MLKLYAKRLGGFGIVLVRVVVVRTCDKHWGYFADYPDDLAFTLISLPRFAREVKVLIEHIKQLTQIRRIVNRFMKRDSYLTVLSLLLSSNMPYYDEMLMWGQGFGANVLRNFVVFLFLISQLLGVYFMARSFCNGLCELMH